MVFRTNLNVALTLLLRRLNGIQIQSESAEAETDASTFCMFGVHMEPYPNRFQRMQTENPALYNYCINELNLKQVLDYCHIPYDKDDYGMGVQLDFEFEE